MRRPRARDDRGAAAVELALVLPVLLLVVFGVVDFGRMLHAQLRLSQAAREGARAAALGADARTRVTRATPGLDGVTTSVVGCVRDAVEIGDAQVTVTYRFTFITPVAGLAALVGGDAGDAVTLTGRGVMPCVV